MRAAAAAARKRSFPKIEQAETPTPTFSPFPFELSIQSWIIIIGNVNLPASALAALSGKTPMSITKAELERAIAADVIDRDGAEQLWQFWHESRGELPRFDMANLFWYAGAVIVLAAVGLYLIQAYRYWGGGSLAVSALVMAAVTGGLGHLLWRRNHARTLGGLLIAVAVVMVPVAALGLQSSLGWFSTRHPSQPDFVSWARSSWFVFDLTALVAAVAAFIAYRFSFILMIAMVGAWSLSYHLVDWVLLQSPGATRSSAAIAHGVVSLVFGLAMLARAWSWDLRGPGNNTYWIHFAAAWGIVVGLVLLLLINLPGREAWTAFAFASALLMIFSVFISRRIYVVVGALGLAAYLVQGAVRRPFGEAYFPIGLAITGLVVMAIGYVYFRYEERLQLWLDRHLPPALKRLRPSY